MNISECGVVHGYLDGHGVLWLAIRNVVISASDSDSSYFCSFILPSSPCAAADTDCAN